MADIALEEASDWASKEGHVVWIGLLEPDRELLLRVQREFHLHDLAIDDAKHPHARPKLEQYGDALFIVARTAQLARYSAIRSDPRGSGHHANRPARGFAQERTHCGVEGGDDLRRIDARGFSRAGEVLCCDKAAVDVAGDADRHGDDDTFRCSGRRADLGLERLDVRHHGVVGKRPDGIRRDEPEPARVGERSGEKVADVDRRRLDPAPVGKEGPLERVGLDHDALAAERAADGGLGNEDHPPAHPDRALRRQWAQLVGIEVAGGTVQRRERRAAGEGDEREDKQKGRRAERRS